MSSCITKFKFRKIATAFKLIHNMRITKGRNEAEVEALSKFAKWVLDIGDGKVHCQNNASVPLQEDDISIPQNFCNLQGMNLVDEMIESTFPDFMNNYQNTDYLSERAILSLTNQTVGHVNSAIVDKIPTKTYSYFSVELKIFQVHSRIKCNLFHLNTLIPLTFPVVFFTN